ncbi:MAG: hypothetical protein U9R24_01135 [Thermodesulfobacteriota bacterium]|nr:hypothetical protein [Thermodesulfobacteriota bacterium]
MGRVRDGCIYLIIPVLTFVVIAGTCILALAHRVTIFAWVEGDTIFTESKFSGGKMAVNSEVQVFDEAGRKLLEGKTNEKGEFSFKIPEMTDLRVVLNAAMGHRAEWFIPEAELRGEVNAQPESGETVESSPERSALLSREEVKKIVEDSLDRKLGPVMRRLTELQDRGPSITEVLGGIGYIFGLMGIAIYFKGRRKGDN